MNRTPQAAAADFAKLNYRTALADYKSVRDDTRNDAEARHLAARVIAFQEAHIDARLTDFNSRIAGTMGLGWAFIGPRKDRLKARLGEQVYRRHHPKGKL